MLIGLRQHEHRFIANGFTASQVTQLHLQEGTTIVGYLREQWCERDVLALPSGEHDFFDRKSGALLDNRQNFNDKISAAISAFSNSGGGHLILGQRDDGTIDGVKKTEGNQPIREWLEIVIASMVQYPLTTFRVHSVQPETDDSQIPLNRELIVIDVGDSRFAPHQAAFPVNSRQYYFRQGGHSVPAPHHYLEALRNRYVSPDLQSTLDSVTFRRCHRDSSGVVVAEIALTFKVKNTGSIAAHRWDLNCELHGLPTSRTKQSDARIGKEDNCRLDWTILPTQSAVKRFYFGFEVSPSADQSSIIALSHNVVVRHQIVTENSIGEMCEIPMHRYFSEDIATKILQASGVTTIA